MLSLLLFLRLTTLPGRATAPEPFPAAPMHSLPLFLSACALCLSPAAAEVPANLVTENIPMVPSGLIADASRYLESRTAGLLSWHPQRLEMLIATRFADTPQLHLVRQPGGARRQLTFSHEPIRS